MAKEMTLREVQLSCLDIMKAFDAFCKENKLTYYLSGGTLLGAVRHQGFIPWDDDVDLMMPREDYQRMLTLDFPDPNYGFFCLEKMADYSRPWVRMTDKRTVISGMAHYSGDTQAICIDIFPIDGVPAGRLATKLFFKRIRLNDALCKSAKRNYTPEGERFRRLKAVLRALLTPIGARRLALRMNRIAMAHPFATSAYRGVSMVTHYGEREKMPAGVFDHSVELPFEGLPFPAPNGYHEYLSRLYGDYMQLPPEHARSCHFARYTRSEEEAS